MDKDAERKLKPGKYEPTETPAEQKQHYFRDQKVMARHALRGLDDNLANLNPETHGAIRNMNLALFYLVEAVDNLGRDVALLHNRLDHLQREVDSLPRNRYR